MFGVVGAFLWGVIEYILGKIGAGWIIEWFKNRSKKVKADKEIQKDDFKAILPTEFLGKWRGKYHDNSWFDTALETINPEPKNMIDEYGLVFVISQNVDGTFCLHGEASFDSRIGLMSVKIVSRDIWDAGQHSTLMCSVDFHGSSGNVSGAFLLRMLDGELYLRSLTMSLDHLFPTKYQPVFAADGYATLKRDFLPNA